MWCLKSMRKQLSLLLVACLLLALVPGACSAAAPETVTMSMQDYQTLKNDFLILKQNNERQQQLLNQLKEQLTQAEKLQSLSGQTWLTLKQQLIEAEKKAALLESQLATLEQQLASAKQASLTAEQSLQSANQSLTELSKAIKKERATADRRETVLKIVAIGAVCYAVNK